MEDPPFATHTPHNPKKRYFTGSGSGNGSTSAFSDPDVIEIPPPATWMPKPPRHNKSKVDHEVIIVDDEDSDDIMIIDEIVAPRSKGKKPLISSFSGISIANNKLPAPRRNKNSHISVVNVDLDEVGDYDDDCALLQAHFDGYDIPTGIEATVAWWPTVGGSEKKDVSASSSTIFGAENFSSSFPIGFPYKARGSHHSSPADIGLNSVGHVSHYPSAGTPTYSDFHQLPVPHWPPPFPSYQHMQKIQAKPAKLLKSSLVGSTNLLGLQYPSQGNPFSSDFFDDSFNPSGYNQSESLDSISADIALPSSEGEGDAFDNLVLKKLEDFVRLDTVEDHSDHHYSKKLENFKQSRNWQKKVTDEWKILEKDLPDTIFVRVYEARLDLLRAVIVGADGTPYHDGLFFFDVSFPTSYPNAPPRVNYHAHGLRINPNLYNCGKVCLSLLGTWSGHGDENWRPGKSNMLQVLVSIQGLILNEEPYYNEPGYAGSRNQKRAQDYRENAFLLSLKTMLYTMRKPPKYFEDLVYGHFYKRAHDILAACRAYLDGVPVGHFEKGKMLDTKKSKKVCSQNLKTSLPVHIKSLVEAFTKIGVKDCNKYIVSESVDEGAHRHTGSRHRGSHKSKHWQ